VTKNLFSSGKFNVGIKTGPALELLIAKQQNQPEYSVPGANQVALENHSPTLVKTSWQWLVAPQIISDITRKISFRIEPSVVIYLNNLYAKTNQPSAQPYGIGLWTGILYKF
jgi:hypothetical protein